MSPQDVVEIFKSAVWVMFKLGAPAMVAALVIGLTISIFQALTQLQEATLSFVPKLVGVFAALVVTMPWTIRIMQEFTAELFGRIGGAG